MGLNVLTSAPEGAERVLSREALAFLESLHRSFDSRRQELLGARAERQKALDRGESFDFLPSTKSIRGGDWKVAPTPKDLQRRHVEITGPTAGATRGAALCLPCPRAGSATTRHSEASGTTLKLLISNPLHHDSHGDSKDESNTL